VFRSLQCRGVGPQYGRRLRILLARVGLVSVPAGTLKPESVGPGREGATDLPRDFKRWPLVPRPSDCLEDEPVIDLPEGIPTGKKLRKTGLEPKSLLVARTPDRSAVKKSVRTAIGSGSVSTTTKT
jgi:hypothetical protein